MMQACSTNCFIALLVLFQAVHDAERRPQGGAVLDPREPVQVARVRRRGARPLRARLRQTHARPGTAASLYLSLFSTPICVSMAVSLLSLSFPPHSLSICLSISLSPHSYLFLSLSIFLSLSLFPSLSFTLFHTDLCLWLCLSFLLCCLSRGLS